MSTAAGQPPSARTLPRDASGSTGDLGAPHDHVFLGTDHRRNENRIWLVIVLTATMMVVEIVAGAHYGSMALVADGWHMSTHAGAMLIAALAYRYARRHADDQRFSFGTGKLGDLAAFASAVVLAIVALLIGWESLLRLATPSAIHFGQAIAVAVTGLAVNLLSAWLLREDHGHHHGHAGHHGHHGHQSHHAAHDHGADHEHGADHDHRADHRHGDHPGRAAQGQDEGHDRRGPLAVHDDPAPQGHTVGQDNNLRAAYAHVLADALTSVLAIVALLLGRSFGWLWADPLMGVVGALVIARWSWRLIRDAGRVLLDAPVEGQALRAQIRQALAGTGDQIQDLHVWRIGPGHFAAIVSIASTTPRDVPSYKALLAPVPALSHVTVEVLRSAPMR